jgi:chromatin remodeling complex protein RSC6
MQMAEKAKTGARKNNALMADVKISDDLAAVVGKGPMPRSQITSKLWVYIREKGLQSKTDKRNIIPDATLAKVIGKDEISMFKMTSAVSKHIG